MIKKLVYTFILVLLFSSCVTTSKVNYLQDLGKKKSPSNTLNSLEEYKLRVGDMVYIKISTLDEDSKNLLSGGSQSSGGPQSVSNNSSSDIYSYTIYSDGSIEFPFIGAIKLAGLTTREAKDSVRTKLKTMVPDCDIDVKLVNASFTIIGASGTGKYDITKERLNIFQALALSGDLKPFSDRARIHILRRDIGGKTQIKVFDVRNKDIINSEFYYIQPNDIIYVQSFSGQFFGEETFSNIVSSVASTFSLSYLLYYYVVPLFKTTP